jgi:molecular chaperone DnaK
MKREAEMYAEEDKKAKETVEKMNMADAFCFSIEKSLEEMSDKVTEDEKSSVSDKIGALKEAIKSGDVSKVESCQKDLEGVWFPITERIYKSQNTSDNAQPDSNQFMSDIMGDKENPFGGANFNGNKNPFTK